MIDILFERSSEQTIVTMTEQQRKRVGQWTHIEVDLVFKPDEELIADLNMSARLILNKEYEPLHVLLLEEGSESTLYQLTQKEKDQIIQWYQTKQIRY
ncbi:hypothetical protein [Alkalicoccobacillus murimartini]|uniref:Uncharacterized protein n=1 Tax=Alkalicoccobacillus murimartini TaxID=171685 RepID=A0ABT9YF57_9BACI|nr:hypothetical protein [Alkalicoccobacillus murimartini]MDQ0206176.1 hypothetical protein [Alkalicoccobacillus murimartini]